MYREALSYIRFRKITQNKSVSTSSNEVLHVLREPLKHTQSFQGLDEIQTILQGICKLGICKPGTGMEIIGYPSQKCLIRWRKTFMPNTNYYCVPRRTLI